MCRTIILLVFIQVSKCLQPDRKRVLGSGVLKPVIVANRRKQEQDEEIEY